MMTEMQAGVVEAPEAAEGLGLLDQIVMQSKVAVTDTEKLSARDQIMLLVGRFSGDTVDLDKCIKCHVVSPCCGYYGW